MSWKFSDKDIEEMKAELRAAGYTYPFYSYEQVVRAYNVWIVKPLCTHPGGKTK